MFITSLVFLLLMISRGECSVLGIQCLIYAKWRVLCLAFDCLNIRRVDDSDELIFLLIFRVVVVFCWSLQEINNCLIVFQRIYAPSLGIFVSLSERNFKSRCSILYTVCQSLNVFRLVDCYKVLIKISFSQINAKYRLFWFCPKCRNRFINRI